MTNKPDTLLTGAELLARYRGQVALSLEEMIDKEIAKHTLLNAELAEVKAQRDRLLRDSKAVLRTFNAESAALCVKGENCDLLTEEITAINARGKLFTAILEIESTEKGE